MDLFSAITGAGAEEGSFAVISLVLLLYLLDRYKIIETNSNIIKKGAI